ncbi:unannotated protein [freshwater metagenome]|uniref:Unannotated protein n=1 Tax=freshwater metagenome TaxID=449393 RepID=A0A6J6MVD0_9ZZZZ
MAVEEEPPLNPLVDSMLVVLESELSVLATRAEVHQIQRVLEPVAVAVAALVQLGKQATVRLEVTVVLVVRVTSRDQHSSTVAVAVAVDPPRELANTVGEMAHREPLETMVSITPAEVQVHQQQEAACLKEVMASSLFATRHQ